MRFISCKIENFGMLHEAEYAFGAPIHIMEAENGAGKSTLAAFLKAMLYGLEGKGRSIEDNERKRYMPWQGGRFGGSLVFLAGGHKYRVERFFGQTPKGDTFALYDADTNLSSDAFSASLGEELFGIDCEAFSRTTFFTWHSEEKSDANNSIHAKLNGLLDATDDIGDFDAAIARLDAERKIYEKRGNLGKLSELEEAIYDISLALQKAAEAEAAATEKTAEYAACVKEKEEAEASLAALHEERKEKQKQSALRGVAAQLLRYDNEMRDSEAAIETLRSAFGGVETPVEEFEPALQAAKDANHRYMIAISKSHDLEKDIAEAKRILDSTPPLPEDRTMEQITEAVMAYAALAAQENGAAADASADAAHAHAKAVLLEAEVAQIAYRDAEDACRRAAEISGNIDTAPTQEELVQIRESVQRVRIAEYEGRDRTSTKPKTAATLFLLLGACLLLAGVLGMVFLFAMFIWRIASACTIAVAITLLAVGIYRLVKTKNNGGSDHRQAAQKWNIAKEKEALKASFSAYGIDVTDDTSAAYEGYFARLSAHAAAYGEYCKAKAVLEEKARAWQVQAKRLHVAVSALTHSEVPSEAQSAAVHITWARNEIVTFEVGRLQTQTQSMRMTEAKAAAEAALAPYFQAEGAIPSARLAALREAVTQHKELKKQTALLLRRVSAYTKQAAEDKAKVDAFLTRYTYEAGDDISAALQAAERAYRDGQMMLARTETLRTERAQYMRDEGITEEMIPELLALRELPLADDLCSDGEEEVLRQRIDGYKAKLYQIGTEIEALRAAADEAPCLQARKASLQKEYEEATHTRDLITVTKGFLERSKTELSTRYLRTMEAHFLKYFRMVAPTRREEIAIDANLTPSVEIGGTRYPTEAFSHGLRDLLGLCMRLALTDSMYEDSTERPPLILDDPFVNLDKEKLHKASALLDALAERYQILYFTCHESRSMR